jgi:hypothetical protein
MSKPEYTPVCCGVEATWVVLSPRLEYWYCRECKQEVDEEEPYPWGRGIADSVRVDAGVWLPNDPLATALGVSGKCGDPNCICMGGPGNAAQRLDP